MEIHKKAIVPNYSDDEDENSWIPFQRSAPEFANGQGWDTGGFVCPFQSTPVEKIHEIAKALDLTEKDIVYDIGCGDGRFIIECCRLSRCKGVGVDLDETLVARARRNAAAIGEKRAEFRQADFLDPDLDLLPATVVFLFLIPEALKLLRPRLVALARSSTSLRSIVSLRWPLPNVDASATDSARSFFLYKSEDLWRHTGFPESPKCLAKKGALVNHQ